MRTSSVLESSNDVLVFDIKRSRQDRKNELKRIARRKRGLQKQGRKHNTQEQDIVAKEKRRKWEKEWKIKYNEYNPQKKLFWTAKARAKRKRLEFDITEEDIVIPEVCPYLGIPFIVQACRGTPRNSIMSLDRIDSTKGYIKGNIEVISWLANTMKNSATEEQLVAFAQEVLSRYG